MVSEEDEGFNPDPISYHDSSDVAIGPDRIGGQAAAVIAKVSNNG